MQEKEPTEYEKSLMEYLGFKSLQELEDFLNQPSWGCPDMQVPDNEEDQREAQWQESLQA